MKTGRVGVRQKKARYKEGMKAGREIEGLTVSQCLSSDCTGFSPFLLVMLRGRRRGAPRGIEFWSSKSLASRSKPIITET
jgi:hypothetical protein